MDAWHPEPADDGALPRGSSIAAAAKVTTPFMAKWSWCAVRTDAVMNAIKTALAA